MPMRKNAFRNKHVLITGGLGFIGSNLARLLVNLGARVTLIDALIPEYGGNIFNIKGIEKQVDLNIANINDERIMRHLVKRQDYLFNLAGQTSHLDSMHNPYSDLEMNCRAQLSVLESCRKYNPRIKIIFASTRQIYGAPEYLPVDEKHPLHPIDINGVNKMAGERYHILYHRIYGIRTCILRLTNTYGPRMRVKDARQTFLGFWIRKAIEGKEINVFGDGRQRRDFNYIEDVLDAFLAAAGEDKVNGMIFNLGSHEHISLINLVKLLIKINGKGTYRLVKFPPERKKIDIGDYYADYRKISKALSWHPAVSLENGLRAALDFYKRYKQKYW